MKIVDLGIPFGLGVADTLWPTAEISTSKSINALMPLIQESDLVIFGGGEDINPAVYNHVNVGSYVVSTGPSARDILEMTVWHLATQAKKPILGICRGAQLACVMSGGFLIQHISFHPPSEHDLQTILGETFPITSAHHQMMWPAKTDHELLAWVAELPQGKDFKSLGYAWDRSKTKREELDFSKHPEVVYFKRPNALGVQGHPEWMDTNHPTNDWIRGLVNQYLFGELTNA